MPRWSAPDDARLRALHAEGCSQHQAAERMGRSRTTVYRASARLGLAWDRSRTQAAVAAVAVDVQQRRSALEAALLGEAERTLAQLRQPQTYFAWAGKGRAPVEHTTPEPMPADQLRLMQAAGLAIDRALKIAQHHNQTTDPAPGIRVIFTGENDLR
ncbi:MAG: hypothetical protein LBS27_03570 [Bifidobacteriaceae bacterium]|jgi:hypothetical protein|nr:hypothetical protein [Bifidobacteriaceae bacterium]